jgi:hypothetical protein
VLCDGDHHESYQNNLNCTPKHWQKTCNTGKLAKHVQNKTCKNKLIGVVTNLNNGRNTSVQHVDITYSPIFPAPTPTSGSEIFSVAFFTSGFALKVIGQKSGLSLFSALTY